MTGKRDNFGIGELGNVPESTPSDDLEAERLQPSRRTGQVMGKCSHCKREVPKILLMTSARGPVCPDCYDRCSD